MGSPKCDWAGSGDNTAALMARVHIGGVARGWGDRACRGREKGAYAVSSCQSRDADSSSRVDRVDCMVRASYNQVSGANSRIYTRKLTVIRGSQ